LRQYECSTVAEALDKRWNFSGGIPREMFRRSVFAPPKVQFSHDVRYFRLFECDGNAKAVTRFGSIEFDRGTGSFELLVERSI